MNLEISINKIRKFFRIQKRLPTYKEMADLFGFASKNAAFKLAQKLIDAGFLEKDASGKLIPKRLFAPLGLAGIVKAGFPVPTEETLVDTISFDEYLIEKPEATFLLKVSGDSMIDAGIHPGDLVLIEKGRPVKPGDIIIAEVDGEWTMKYYQKENGNAVLVPANKNYPKIYPKQQLTVGGIVVSVVRKYN